MLLNGSSTLFNVHGFAIYCFDDPPFFLEFFFFIIHNFRENNIDIVSLAGDRVIGPCLFNLFPLVCVGSLNLDYVFFWLCFFQTFLSLLCDVLGGLYALIQAYTLFYYTLYDFLFYIYLFISLINFVLFLSLLYNSKKCFHIILLGNNYVKQHHNEEKNIVLLYYYYISSTI